MRNIIQTKNAPKPVGPYSQAIKVDKFLFVSGQVAIDPKIGKIKGKNIREQTRQVMENIKAILDAAGYNFSSIVQSNVYLSSMELFNQFNKEYSKYFEGAFPARVTVGTELGLEALVEISVIAYKE